METTYTICIIVAICIGLYDGVSKSMKNKHKSNSKIDEELINYFLRGK